MKAGHADTADPLKGGVVVVDQAIRMCWSLRMSIGINKASFALGHLTKDSFLQKILMSFE